VFVSKDDGTTLRRFWRQVKVVAKRRTHLCRAHVYGSPRRPRGFSVECRVFKDDTKRGRERSAFVFYFRITVYYGAQRKKQISNIGDDN